jgi:hypothetical protein
VEGHKERQKTKHTEGKKGGEKKGRGEPEERYTFRHTLVYKVHIFAKTYAKDENICESFFYFVPFCKFFSHKSEMFAKNFLESNNRFTIKANIAMISFLGK